MDAVIDTELRSDNKALTSHISVLNSIPGVETQPGRGQLGIVWPDSASRQISHRSNTNKNRINPGL